MTIKDKVIPSLTEEEIEIIKKGATDVDLITDYFFRKRGASKGFIFDENFDPEGAWQKAVHFAKQSRIIVIGGFGTGKTRFVGISACVFCLTMKDFAFMNCAPKAWQSELMYNFIIERTRETRMEDLIYAKPKRPYPKIEFRFYVNRTLVVSTMEFMSVDKNANTILSWEGDWCNIDEGGQLDDLSRIITNLSSRLRGSINGRDRLDRFSIMSNSWDNPDLWYRYDLAKENPEDYLSITVSTRHNHNVTPKQLKLMLRDIPEDEHERFIDGSRPVGMGNYFTMESIYAAEDPLMSETIKMNTKNEVPGYDYAYQPGTGIIYYKVPAQADRTYMIFGDPGTDNAPNRNAPVLHVWDVTDFPASKATIVGFWWGSGHTKLSPFIKQMLQFMADFNPFFTGIDSTGTQKNTSDLINAAVASSKFSGESRTDFLGGVDMGNVINTHISGFDFGGNRKPAYLIAGKILLEAKLVTWAKFAIGMRTQLSNYDLEKDAQKHGHLAQDLVATFCIGAWAIRRFFVQQLEEFSNKDTGLDLSVSDTGIIRDTRLSSQSRSQRYSIREISREL